MKLFSRLFGRKDVSSEKKDVSSEKKDVSVENNDLLNCARCNKPTNKGDLYLVQATSGNLSPWNGKRICYQCMSGATGGPMRTS